jgi:hypothetical protein
MKNRRILSILILIVVSFFLPSSIFLFDKSRQKNFDEKTPNPLSYLLASVECTDECSPPGLLDSWCDGDISYQKWCDRNFDQDPCLEVGIVSRDCNASDTAICVSGGFLYTYDFYCENGICRYTMTATSCGQGVSDTDGGYNLEIGGICGKKGCSSYTIGNIHWANCTTEGWKDSCSGNTLDEYYPASSGGDIYCTHQSVNCENLEYYYCDEATGKVYRNEYQCSYEPCKDQPSMSCGYCDKNATDTFIEKCEQFCSDPDGDDYFKKGTTAYGFSCPSGNAYCPKHEQTDSCWGKFLIEGTCLGKSFASIQKNCDDFDVWRDTGNTQWKTCADNPCKDCEEKEQVLTTDYFCSDGACVSTTPTTLLKRWIPTGNTKNKEDGYNGCGNGCQRCVSGSCQDYNKACEGTNESCYCLNDECRACSPGEQCSNYTCSLCTGSLSLQSGGYPKMGGCSVIAYLYITNCEGKSWQIKDNNSGEIKCAGSVSESVYNYTCSWNVGPGPYSYSLYIDGSTKDTASFICSPPPSNQPPTASFSCDSSKCSGGSGDSNCIMYQL